MVTLITYDLKEQDPDLHEVVRKEILKNEAFSAKYLIPLASTVFILPNTTFYSNKYSPGPSVDYLKEICKKFGANLERCIAVKVEGNPAGIPGIPF